MLGDIIRGILQALIGGFLQGLRERRQERMLEELGYVRAQREGLTNELAIVDKAKQIDAAISALSPAARAKLMQHYLRSAPGAGGILPPG
jgi:hypothetical protein